MRHTLALCILLLASANGQSDEKTDCSKLDFTDLPKDCCKNPFGEFFKSSAFSVTFKECKGNPKVIEWANSYKLNALQQKDLKNFIDLTNKNTISELCSAGAFMECIGKSTTMLLSNGSLNADIMYQILNGGAPNDKWKTIVLNTIRPMVPAFTNFYSFNDILEDRFEKITCPSGEVNLLPLMFAQMLQSEFIWMCPQQNVYSTKNKCTEKMLNFQYCDGKIYSPTAKGVFFFPSV